MNEVPMKKEQFNLKYNGKNHVISYNRNLLKREERWLKAGKIAIDLTK